MILGLIGSYRKGGTIDNAVTAVLSAVEERGVKAQKIYLQDIHIEFCSNCRRCTQEFGPNPVRCYHDDDMWDLIQLFEKSDGFVLGAPVNFGNVNALTQRFLERLVCYTFWPWGQPSPKMRKSAQSAKRAVLITSSAMPSLMGRFMTGSLRGMKLGAKAMGANTIHTVYLGLSAMKEHQEVKSKLLPKFQKAANKLFI
jgi:multimeric flavodoxin WrbA